MYTITPAELDSERIFVLNVLLLVFLVSCTQLQIKPGFKQMSVPEAKQGKPARTDSCFLSATLSQCTLVIEDLQSYSSGKLGSFSICSCSVADVLTLGQQSMTSLEFK